MKNIVKIEKAEGELVIREGAAKPLVDPKPVRFTGTFGAVVNWWNVRKNDVKKDIVKYSYIKYSYDSMKIELVVDEQKEYQDILIGLISKTDDLSGFKINETSIWTIDGFKKHIRLNKHLFHSEQEYTILLKELTTYSTSVKNDINATSDNRGNGATNVTREVKTNIPTKFELVLSPYKGYEKIQFPVEIYLESDGKSVYIQLFSSELESQLLLLQDKIFRDTLDNFAEIPKMEY